MTVASFVISVLALCVAFGALWYTRRQANAAHAETLWKEARPWVISREGDQIKVTNNMTSPAIDVVVSVPDAGFDLEESAASVAPGGTLTLETLEFWGSNYQTLQVEWKGPKSPYVVPYPNRAPSS